MFFTSNVLRSLRLLQLKTAKQKNVDRLPDQKVAKLKSKFPLTLGLLNQALNNPVLACVSQKTRKCLGPVDFSGLFSGEFLGSRKAFLNASENTPDSHPSFSGCFLGFAARG